MKSTHKIIAPLIGAVLLVILVVMVTFWAFQQTKASAEARKNSYATIIQANALLSELKDAETAERGYLLTGDETFLQPYLAARNGIGNHLNVLRQFLLSSDVRQHVDKMAPLVEAEMADISKIIELHRQHDIAGAVALVSGGQGKQLMDTIRTGMREILRMENDDLALHEAVFQSNMNRLFTIIISASLLALLLVLAFGYLVYLESRHRQKDLLHLDTKQSLETQERTNRELRQANMTLQVSEEKTAVTLKSIGDAVIVTDATGHVTLLNSLAEKLTGWTQAEACNHPVDEVFRIISQETRLPALVPVQEVLEKGTKKGLANHTVLITRDGGECAIADSCAPIRDGSGKVVGAVLVFRDVTEEYAVQQELRDNAALIKTILNTVVDGVITIHASGGMIETVNAAAERMFGYSAADIIGKNFSVLVPELDGDQRNGSLEYYSPSEEARAAGLEREVAGQRKDGRKFPLEIAVSEMWLGGKRYFTGILRDVGARKRVEAERNVALEMAEKANRAKTDFLSSMSHELRTPLNAVLGFAQLMEASAPPPSPAQKRNIDQILKAGWYLLELINEILDLALIESGRVALSREPVALVEVMFECRAMIEPQAQKRGIQLTFPRFEYPLFINADRTRVKQVLINLLFNAIKYNRPGGAVIVECTTTRSGSIRIDVRDTGAGLTPPQLAQLFQPFNRMGKEAGGEEGTGIGLVVTKRLVELMGGTIGVESSVGVGSVFWIELALAAAPMLAAQDAEHVAVVRPDLPRSAPLRTLLYVEDNPANLELVEQLIARRSDLRLLTAADGNLGIEFARVYQPDVILMDINLPGISGIDAMTMLRQDPTTAHIPIIALSANAVPRDIEHGLEAGFFNYLTKPIKVNQFMDALDVALKFTQDASNPIAEEEQT